MACRHGVLGATRAAWRIKVVRQWASEQVAQIRAVLAENRDGRDWVQSPPAFAVIGLGIVLFPMDVQKLEREHGVDRVRRWDHLPTVWRVLVVVMFCAALANVYLVTGRFF
jgi:hypothetical protein